MIERVIHSAPVAEEETWLSALRPQRLDDCIGQEAVKEQLRIAIAAARGRGEPLDHLLLDGPPGLGKTTFAHVIANEMNATIRVTSGPAITRQGDLMAMLTQMETGDILFVDEIHRLSKPVEEFLYPALEDFRVDFTHDTGLGGRTVNFNLSRFTLIGATTRAGLLSAALRGRFGHILHFGFYDGENLARIVARSAGLLSLPAEAEAIERLAGRARGTPRIANRLLRRVRDYAQVRGDGRMTPGVVDQTMDIHGVDPRGLDALDRSYLGTLLDHYDGGPAGIEAIAASMGHERDTLEDTVEPYLLQVGFIIRTPRGRVVRPAAYAHLGLKPPERPSEPASGPSLFE